MSAWLSDRPQSFQLIGCAVLGSIATFTILHGAGVFASSSAFDVFGSLKQRIVRNEFREKKEDHVPLALDSLSREDARAVALAARARSGDYDDELIVEQLARNRVFLGETGLQKLRNSFVVVVGLGGVGSHATCALARSGVAKLRLIDFDLVTLSSLNRHAVATLADVGTPKVHCMRRRLEQITPWIRFDCRNELFQAEAAEALLGGWGFELRDGEKSEKPDFVIDCIDNIDSKVALLAYCHKQGLKVISSMGAGCKSDPTRLCVGDISLSNEDPLSRSTRRRLRILGVKDELPVVFSTEKPGPGKAELLPLKEDEVAKGQVGELGILPNFRVRILPVLGTMPAMFGYAIANHVICSIAGYPLGYRAGDRGRDKLYAGILGSVHALEGRLHADSKGLAPVGLRLLMSLDDVGYLIEEVFRGKSVVSGLATRLTLIRWRRPTHGYIVDPKGLKDDQVFSQMKLHDLVCMTKEEAKRHEAEILKGDKDPEDVYEPDVILLVSRRIEEESQFSKFR